MPNKLLIERFNTSKMKYISEAREENGKRYLGRFEGPAADLIHPTRNGRKYGLKLWRNVEASEEFKEGMDTLTIFGEADHPETRLETLIKEVAIVLRKFEIRENEGIVWCSFDILDTPNGRTLKSILDYGSQIGVSSRGSGEEIQVNGETEIDPDTYIFICFDAVVMPAVKAARPKVVESADLTKTKTLTESIKAEIESASTAQELKSIKSIIEAAKVPELDSLVESINIKLSNIPGDDISEKLMADLGESVNRVKDLEAKVEILESKLSAKNIRMRQMKETLSESVKNSNTISRFLQESRRKVASLENDLLESANQCDEFDESSSKIKLELLKLKKANKNLVNENQKLISRNNELSESKRMSKLSESKMSRLYESHNAETQRLTEKFNSERTKLLNEKKDLEKKLTEAISSRDSTLAESNKLKTNVDNLRKSNKKLKSENSGILNSYIAMRAKTTGVSSSVLRSRLPEKFSLSDVDKAVMEMMNQSARISRIPVAIPSGQVTSIFNESVRMSDEDIQTLGILSAMKEKF